MGHQLELSLPLLWSLEYVLVGIFWVFKHVQERERKDARKQTTRVLYSSIKFKMLVQ